MRWSIAYGLMILSLGSVAGYGAMNIEQLRNPLGDRAFVADYTRQTPVIVLAPLETPTTGAAPATQTAAAAGDAVPPSSAHGVTSDGVVHLTLGMTSDRVFAELGEPDQTSTDGTRWSYGSTTLIFNNSERLAGSVSHDPVQAAMNKFQNVMATIEPTDRNNGKTASKSNSGPKILRYKPTQQTQSSKGRRYQRDVNGSSRDGRYRYDSLGLGASYYMGRSGPMERFFHRKNSLPRGMSSTHRRNTNATYGTLNNLSSSRLNSTQRRR